jgi:hypothetical protein
MAERHPELLQKLQVLERELEVCGFCSSRRTRRAVGSRAHLEASCRRIPSLQYSSLLTLDLQEGDITEKGYCTFLRLPAPSCALPESRPVWLTDRCVPDSKSDEPNSLPSMACQCRPFLPNPLAVSESTLPTPRYIPPAMAIAWRPWQPWAAPARRVPTAPGRLRSEQAPPSAIAQSRMPRPPQ